MIKILLLTTLTTSWYCSKPVKKVDYKVCKGYIVEGGVIVSKFWDPSKIKKKK